MQPYYDQSDITIYHGDLLDVLPTLPEASIDFVVTDPPYGLGFMGKGWDHGVPGPVYWQALARVCKPGALLLAFGGTRTYHRLICAIEDAGWEIRDCLMWLYGQGFPKAADVGKMIDKAKGAKREVVGTKVGQPGYSLADNGRTNEIYGDLHDPEAECAITAPATPLAAKWTGWANALKPAVEPLIVAQKPPNGLQPAQVSLHRRLNLIEEALWRILCARAAASTSEANEDDASVLEIAALPAKSRAALFDQMDTLQFESVLNTSLSIVTSWRSILDGGCDPTSTSIIGMATEPTIDWKTLNCCAWEITPADIIQAAMEVHGSKCGAAPAVRYFNAVAMSIFATRELSVLADATWPQHTSYQDEDGLELCPDWRPIVLAMKPLDGTLAHNAEKWGVAGLHIDAGRIDAEDHPGVHKSMSNRLHDGYRRPWRDGGPPQYKPTPTGRWPANLLLDEDAAILLDQQSGCSKSTAQPRHNAAFKSVAKGQEYPRTSFGYEDAGGASRFFYCGKATKKDRGPGNDHPTVKPLALMKYLLTLLATPDGGVILDPFAGSGTTALAAKQLGRRCICVELDEHYCEIAASRLES